MVYTCLVAGSSQGPRVAGVGAAASLHSVQPGIPLTNISATGSLNKHGMLPASVRGSERSLPTATLRDDRDHSGYFSDRNDSYGSRRDLYDRGYMSDHERR